MKRHLEINFRGRPRGLAVMQFAVRAAHKSGLAGYVKRLPTGTVHIEAEGEEENLKRFLKACQERPEWAGERDEFSVSDKLIGYEKFYIRKQG